LIVFWRCPRRPAKTYPLARTQQNQPHGECSASIPPVETRRSRCRCRPASRGRVGVFCLTRRRTSGCWSPAVPAAVYMQERYTRPLCTRRGAESHVKMYFWESRMRRHVLGCSLDMSLSPVAGRGPRLSRDGVKRPLPCDPAVPFVPVRRCPRGLVVVCAPPPRNRRRLTPPEVMKGALSEPRHPALALWQWRRPRAIQP